MATTDVHTEHCCAKCGCKYSDPECTVVTGKLPQSYAHGIDEDCIPDPDVPRAAVEALLAYVEAEEADACNDTNVAMAYTRVAEKLRVMLANADAAPSSKP